MTLSAAHNRRAIFALIISLLVVIPLLSSQPASAQVDVPPFSINGQIYPVTIQPGSSAGAWLVSLREFAEQTGIAVEWLQESKTVRVKDHQTVAYLQVDSRIALVNSAEHRLAEPLQLTDDRLMVPLGFLAEVFGYEITNSVGQVAITTPTKLITNISASVAGGRPVVDIRTSGLPRYAVYLLASPDRIVVDLYDTSLDVNGAFNGAVPAETAIQGIRWHQFKPNIARVVIDLDHSVGYEVFPAPDGKGLRVSLYKQVRKVSFQRIFDRAQLDIQGSGTLDYSITYLHAPERLVIDVEKATLATPTQEIELQDPLVSKIRINQFLPNIVRTVLDLKVPAGAVATQSGDPNVLLFELVRKITGVEVSPIVDGRQAFLIRGGGVDQFAVQYFPDLAQILVDIPSAILDTKQPRLVFDQGPVTDVKMLQVAATSVQVQIGLRGYRGHDVVQDPNGIKLMVNESPLAGRRIVIDPGHGGQDPGAIGRTGLREKDIVLDIALRLRKLLQVQGAEVIMARESDSYLALEERASLSSQVGAEAFVSIHVNSSMNRAANGTETYYYYTNPKGQELATLIQREMLLGLKLSNRAPRPNRDFVVLKENRVPAVLTEVAFISNKAEEKLLAKKDFRQQAAEAIQRGLVSYFGGPSWRYRELLTAPSDDDLLQEFLTLPPDAQGNPETVDEFSWEQLKVNPDKPGAGIVDKVQVIQIQ